MPSNEQNHDNDKGQAKPGLSEPQKAFTRTYKLDDLLAGMTPKNLHPETDWGRPVGAEIIER